MSTPRSVASPADPVAASDFANDIRYYLALDPRQLPSQYLYDALGSALFNAICELPWYGITRAELRLLARHGSAIAAHAPRLSRIVELGPGNGSKLRALLEAMRSDGLSELPRRVRGPQVHLVDVSAKALQDAGQAVARTGAEVVTHQTTYEAGLSDIAQSSRGAGPTLVLFLGSNIGNFDTPGAEAFLRSVRSSLSRGDLLLLGADLVKPEADLLLAYDDPLGVTAAFNRNLLVRINRELGADFDVGAFAHRAVWNAGESRIEMHLIALGRQNVRIPAAQVEIALQEGEAIWTESSYKYELSMLEALLSGAGFRAAHHWSAPDERFVLILAHAD